MRTKKKPLLPLVLAALCLLAAYALAHAGGPAGAHAPLAPPHAGR
jgi:hypothetical protein